VTVASSIAVVTKRAGLALTMHTPTHHFVEVRPVAGWQTRTWAEDVVVLDLETAESTLSAIETLTGSGVEAPVIVVATDSDGWDELLSLYPDLSLVSLPIMPASMLSAVDRAVRHSHADRSVRDAVPVGPDEAVPAGAAPPVPEPGPAPPPAKTSPAVAPETPPSPRRAKPPREVATPPPAPVPPPQAEPVPAAASASVSQPAKVKTKGARRAKSREAVAERKAPPPEAPEAPTPEPEPRRHRVGDPRQTLMTMVHGLSRDASRLSRVHEVAEVIRRNCAGSVDCGASAVLVPDGDVWRVAAGQHLRPLEERFQITTEHWLVTEVATAHHGVLIKDTDIARTKLGGAPLVSWPNLLALPVEEVGAIVLLARDGNGFGRGDLTKVRQALGDAGTQLRDAVDVRDLARRLAKFTDLVE
jgi:hypothetical protein